MNIRKTIYLGNSVCKDISIQIKGWKSSPAFYIRFDGIEREVGIHIGLFIGIFITFSNLLPERFYPKAWSKYNKAFVSDEKEVSIKYHHKTLWWAFWINDDDRFNRKYSKLRVGNFHLWETIIGKHKCEFKELERREFTLPFLEGNYNVEVTKKLRVDSWQRWFSEKSICYEVRAGYYLEDGETWIDVGIPHEGKGENSWDCGEDATYGSYFPAKEYGSKFEKQTCYEAALYFWKSNMRTRERYGSHNWVPKLFKGKPIEIIKKENTHLPQGYAEELLNHQNKNH